MFPDHATSIPESVSNTVSNLLSEAQSANSLSGLGSEISDLVQERQDYAGEHHLTAADTHKLVEDIHAKIASSADFHF